MRFAEERRHHRHGEQQQQPRLLQQEDACQGDQRHEALRRRQEQREQPDAPHRLAAGALQVIVNLGVLELRQIERRRMLHQAHADAVAEQVAEQALEQRREARQRFPHHGEAELQPDQAAQVPPVHGRAGRLRAHRGNHAVNDQLPHPQHRERHERAHRAQRQDRYGVAALSLVDQLEQRRHVAQGGEALRPGGRRPAVPGPQAPGPREHTVRDETGSGHRMLNLARRGPSV